MSAGPTNIAGSVLPSIQPDFSQFRGLFARPPINPMPDKGPQFIPPGPPIREPFPDKGPQFVPPGPPIQPTGLLGFSGNRYLR